MRMPLGKASFETRAAILRLYAGDWPTGRIAKKFGVTEASIRAHASRVGLRKGQMADLAGSVNRQNNADVVARHQSIAKAARRGAEIPAECEKTYVDLLVSGLDRTQAAARACREEVRVDTANANDGNDR